VDPAVAGFGALADREAVGGKLGEGVVAPGGDVLQRGRHPGVPGGDVRQLLALDLRGAYGGARVAAQAGDPLDSLGEEAVVGAGEADVPIVELVGERDADAQAQALDEVTAALTRLLDAVVRDRVDDSDRLGPGAQVEADDEGQPGAAAALVLASRRTTARTGPDCSTATVCTRPVKRSQRVPGPPSSWSSSISGCRSTTSSALLAISVPSRWRERMTS